MAFFPAQESGSNLVFHQQGTTIYFHVPDSYFLVDENLPDSKSIRLSIPIEKYKAVSFLISEPGSGLCQWKAPRFVIIKFVRFDALHLKNGRMRF
ncbi:hypothetical protein [Pseudoflavitalea rhizosphaerae]|uniref:hypothetical protein n=1 Tax=Pseudoflavitalea rhizosphaerae TaxID=1884793 RepID=UPI000F8DB7DC|nr:hypothetical protein [Pseudoflavitalea rhizosphaerae]